MKHVLLALGLIACSNTVNQEDMEKNLHARMVALGAPEATVKCPSSLSAKVGSVGVCKVTLGEATYDLEVTVTSIENGKAMTDTKWKGVVLINARELEKGFTPVLSEELGAPVTIDCGAAFRPLDAARAVVCDLEAGMHASKVTFTFDDKLEPTLTKYDPPLLAMNKLIAHILPSVRAKTKPTVEMTCAEMVMPRPADGVVRCTLVDGGAEVARILVTVDAELKLSNWETTPL
jgi:hypothetical protein